MTAAIHDPIRGRSILVTGANRGLGHALVAEALARGAGHVHAAMRDPHPHPDPRVTVLRLDLLDHDLVAAVAARIDRLDLLVNNAGVMLADALDEPAVLEHHLTVNLFGPLALTTALLPQLERSGGAVVNVLSLASISAVPTIPAYSISKAAAFALTQAQRTLLAPRGVRVHAVLAGPVDTDMVRDLPVPKTAPADVARGILDGLAAGEEEIFPDPMAATIASGWATGATKTLERANAALLTAGV